MIFWFKKKQIVVDCFTFMEGIALNFPIDKAIKFYPKEFKNLPKNIDLKYNQDPESKLVIKVPTIKSCTGITDLYTRGFVIPAWDTFSIEMLGDSNYSLFSESNTVQTDYHNRSQYGQIYPNSGHIKLLSPWLLKEKTGVKFLWIHSGWTKTNNTELATIPPAVIDYKYQFNTHISFFIRNGCIINYDVGDPLVHMIPLTEDTVKLKIHVIEEDAWHKQRQATEKFAHLNNHRKLNYPNFLEQSKKCPFGFGK